VQWHVEVLNEKVEAEIEAWPYEVRAALTKIVERIEQVGLMNVHEPHVRQVARKLWEMRPSAIGQEGRALYVTASGRRVIIVAAFMKKTQKTPRHMIDLALDRAKGVRS
jgi:phage-related protein